MRRYPPPKTGHHTGWSPGRDRVQQERFRRALIARAGGRCEYVHADPYADVMVRCGSTDRLQAHHDQPGYEPECGRLLCWRHHKAEDPHAR